MFMYIIVICLSACNNTSENKQIPATTGKDSIKVVSKPKEEAISRRHGIINITDTLSIKRYVLTMRDSVSSYDRIGAKLGGIYGEKIGAILKKTGVKMTGQPMAWYTTNKAPYFFEAGVPIDKRPAKLPAKFFIKEIGIDSVVVAHFYGPYDLLPEAYEAVKEYLKDKKRKPKGIPYEIYIGDPFDKEGKPVDPYKVQTDVVFPWK
jgi:effector-binding domain-containing protein